MKREIVLVNRKGQEETRLAYYECDTLVYAGRLFGHGVSKLNGEHHFYEVKPQTPPMGNPQLKYRFYACDQCAKERLAQ